MSQKSDELVWGHLNRFKLSVYVDPTRRGGNSILIGSNSACTLIPKGRSAASVTVQDLIDRYAVVSLPGEEGHHS